MVYKYDQILTKKNTTKFALIGVALVFAMTLMMGALSSVSAKKNTPANTGSNGKVTFDTDVFSSSDDEMDYGDGIPNGEWIVAETQGVQLGVRATDRTDGPIDIAGTNGDRVGVYAASTGFEDLVYAEWNYEWSVDLSNAKGNAAGKDLSDYKLILEQDFTEQSLYGADFPPGLGSDPVQLPFIPGVCEVLSDDLCQQSWNPIFGNDDFEPDEEGVYNLRFVLTPETFNGPPVAVAIQVVVTDSAE